MEGNYEVSVILASYNPDYHKLIKTVKSVIVQAGVKFELIICDDGSQENYFSNLVNLFDEYGFKDYRLVANEVNKGTVYNYNSGLNIAEGKYVKGISPGDYFYTSDILSKWVIFMDSKNAGISFGHAVYYKMESEVPVAIKRKKEMPAVSSLYNSASSGVIGKLQKIDWLVNRDRILGIQVFCRTDLSKKYIEYMLGRVKFAEDYMYRIMLIDNVSIYHFNEPVVYYEYGDGISSNPERKKKFLYNDNKAFNDIVKSDFGRDSFTNRYNAFISATDRHSPSSLLYQVYSVLYFPLSLPWKVFKLAYKMLGLSKPFCSIENGIYYEL